MIIKVVQVRDVAIIKVEELQPCADVLTFKAGRELEICGMRYELSDDLGEFKKGLLILGGVPFFVECNEERLCIAARAK